MKNLKQIVLMFILCLSSLSVIVGCGEKTIDSMAIKSGLQYTYYSEDDYSSEDVFKDIVLEVNYNDGTK